MWCFLQSPQGGVECVVLHSQIASEEGAFDIEDVAKDLNEKLIHRHPHIFGDVKVNSTQEILENWDKLKNPTLLIRMM